MYNISDEAMKMTVPRLVLQLLKTMRSLVSAALKVLMQLELQNFQGIGLASIH